MAHLPCVDLLPAEEATLLSIARRSIRQGAGGAGPRVDEPGADGSLASRQGVFVTLTLGGRLRGCIGSLRATAPLVQSVADAAYGAAYEDPRFPPLRQEDMGRVRIEISVLSTMAPLSVNGRDELLDILRPGEDGLLLEDGRRRSTFLPKVWEQIPCPGEFLDQLLAKAGLPAHHWSPSLRFFRYRAVSFGEP